jgi:hypothetical protein
VDARVTCDVWNNLWRLAQLGTLQSGEVCDSGGIVYQNRVSASSLGRREEGGLVGKRVVIPNDSAE